MESAASVLSSSSSVSMKPRSWAASVASRPMPMLVGEVRCATRGVGRLLEVVRRQPVVLGAHEVLEVPPGLAGHAQEVLAVLVLQLDAAVGRGLAQDEGDEGRGRPEEQHRQRGGQGLGAEEPDEGQPRQGDHRARHHLHPERAHPGRAGAPGGRLAAAVSHSSRRRWVTPRRTRVGTMACDHLERLVGDEGELQHGPGERRLQLFPHSRSRMRRQADGWGGGQAASSSRG